MFKPKDFLETAEGLLFAVVSAQLEQDKCLCFLRYVKHNGQWRKYATDDANVFLQQNYPEYLHYSQQLDAELHAVELHRVSQHHCPRRRLHNLLTQPPDDEVEQDLYQLAQLLFNHKLDLTQVGITGSLLAAVHNTRSDIDLVCYEHATFEQARALIEHLVNQGWLSALSEADWHESYQRRDSELSFTEYVWHEQRKFNKAVINGRKFDLSLVNSAPMSTERYHKLSAIKLRCQVLDDSQAFAYPAQLGLNHPEITSVVSFTATYNGQAFYGETVEIAGLLEQSESGQKRIVVGSSREAKGEYIKVIHA
ncbi:hypothetical protein [Methylocucumis oryzae]|uniref:Polymerase nucleotidyl transferase domain-containing protein n=1 Tax=Methylocucumis oryzae TaxID=1632867 RepID=A0A0F3IHQ2_9GAMM|nr:hypothetical protein [Methylocucumis oryzae]KJV06207.1 hypothetical protein VZ94_12835 [Methylocucumis oryzae]